jgi:hypothetical protein
MSANARGFGFGVGFGFCLGWLSLLEVVVMFLNGEGGGQQVLKGLLVQCQVGPTRGHGIEGERMIQTVAIVVQVRASENEKREGYVGRDSRLGMPMWKRFMRTA